MSWTSLRRRDRLAAGGVGAALTATLALAAVAVISNDSQPVSDGPAASAPLTEAPDAGDGSTSPDQRPEPTLLPTIPPTTAPPTTAPPTTAPPTTAPPTTVRVTTVAPSTTTTPATTSAPATTTTTAPTTTTTTTTTAPAAAEVPESRAVVRGGVIYLEGAVPTQEVSDALQQLAASVLGPENVVNNYTIDARASDPTLGNITVEDTINFASGSAQLLPEAEPLLGLGLALLTSRPQIELVIVGHTDALGSHEYNLDLSQRRADAVKAWFVERGVDPVRLATVARGEDEPIADNGTLDGRRLNRRIQFFLTNLLAD